MAEAKVEETSRWPNQRLDAPSSTKDTTGTASTQDPKRKCEEIELCSG